MSIFDINRFIDMMEETKLSKQNIEMVYKTILNKPMKHKFNVKDHHLSSASFILKKNETYHLEKGN